MLGNQAIGFAGDYLLRQSMGNALNSDFWTGWQPTGADEIRMRRRLRPYEIARTYFARLNAQLARDCGVRVRPAGSFYDGVAAIAAAYQR